MKLEEMEKILEDRIKKIDRTCYSYNDSALDSISKAMRTLLKVRQALADKNGLEGEFEANKDE